MKLKENLSKKDIETKIKETFTNNPSSKEIKKIKKLAMSKNIKLEKYRKLFCKRCYTFFDSDNSKIRIKNGLKRIQCNNCNHVSRYQL